MKKKAMRLAVGIILAVLAAAVPGFGADKDTLVVGVSSDVHTLDPAVSSDNYDWRQIYPAYDRLVKYKVVNGEGSTEVEPMAAESWTVSPDSLVWTFKIRKGIKFDDGTALDAKAVKFSFDRVLKIGKGPADNIGAIKAVDVVDDATVKITLKSAFGPFLQTLATDAASIVNPNAMKNEKAGDLAQAWLAQNMDGSGPYKMTEWSRGERLVLTAKDNYWGPKPKLKRVIVRFMRESSDQRMALESGDIDIAEGILIDQVPALEKNANIVVRRYPSQLVEYVYLNCQVPKLQNKLVRQALNAAVDYPGIINHVLRGNGVQMLGPVPKGMWGHKPDVFQYKRDVAKAKALLKQAGAEKLDLTLIYSERRPSWEQIATILQEPGLRRPVHVYEFLVRFEQLRPARKPQPLQERAGGRPGPQGAGAVGREAAGGALQPGPGHHHAGRPLYLPVSDPNHRAHAQVGQGIRVQPDARIDVQLRVHFQGIAQS
jgi:peptide/nickel transport system substrate-binding protein